MNDNNQKADRPHGVFSDVESDGRIKFVLMRHGKSMANVVLPAQDAGIVAANALAAANASFEQSGGVIPPSEREPGRPIIRITHIGIIPAPMEGHACITVKAGAAEIGFVIPLDKLREFGRVAATIGEGPEKA